MSNSSAFSPFTEHDKKVLAAYKVPTHPAPSEHSELEKLLLALPDKPWSRTDVAKNPGLSLGFIKTHLLTTVEVPWWSSLIGRGNHRSSSSTTPRIAAGLGWHLGEVLHCRNLDADTRKEIIHELVACTSVPEFISKNADYVQGITTIRPTPSERVFKKHIGCGNPFNGIFLREEIFREIWIKYYTEHGPFIRQNYLAKDWCEIISEYPDVPATLIKNNTQLPWNWKLLSKRPDAVELFTFTTNRAPDNPKDWDFSVICSLQDISLAFFRTCNFSKRLDFSALLARSDMTLAWIKEHLAWLKVVCPPETLSRCSLLTLSFIDEHLSLLNLKGLSLNYAVVTLDYIQETSEVGWDYHALSSHPELTEEFIIRHIWKGWDFPRLITRGLITFKELCERSSAGLNKCTRVGDLNEILECVQAFTFKPTAVGTENLLENPGMTSEFIETHYYLFKWNMNVVFNKFKLSGDFISQHLKMVSTKTVLLSTYASLNFIHSYPEKVTVWDFSVVSAREDLTLAFVQKHPEFPWDLKVLILNPSVTENLQDAIDLLNGDDHHWNILSSYPGLTANIYYKIRTSLGTLGCCLRIRLCRRSSFHLTERERVRVSLNKKW